LKKREREREREKKGVVEKMSFFFFFTNTEETQEYVENLKMKRYRIHPVYFVFIL